MSENNDHIHEIEKFYGCYLLVSLNTNKRFKGGTYIGFTVNPNRRIKQHNAGYDKGGAKRTSGKGPWEMVLIIHGFPNMISALRFEWAWQNPEKSIRLKHLVPKAKKQNFLFKFNVVSEMLRVGPWCRLPLTIRWLKQEYKQDFTVNKLPPSHMAIVYGPVTVIDLNKKNAKQDSSKSNLISCSQSTSKACFICKKEINASSHTLRCLKCRVEMHQSCLAKHFLRFEPLHLVPIESDCPKCNQSLLWGDLVRFKIGCYKDLECSILDDIENEEEDEVINSGSDSDSN